LSAARRDGDRVHAVVHGSAVVQDGRSNGLSAPNGVAQRRVIRRALARAGVAAERVEYVEAHGTGTPLGDPIELHALADCYGRAGTAACRVGAVKGAIGHLEGAAGIAGLIKTILALRHETIPPNHHLRSPNSRADIAGTRLALPTEAVPWPARAEPRFAAVSSFGFGGTLAHAIVGDDPAARAAARVRRTDDPRVLMLSAHDRPALRELAARYTRLCAAVDDLAGLCASVAATRTAFAERVSFRFDTRDGLIARLRAFAATGNGASSDAPAAASAPVPLRPSNAWELPLYPFGGREYRVALAPSTRRLPPQTFVTAWTRVALAERRAGNGAVRPCLLAGDEGAGTALIAAAIDRHPALERVASLAPDGRGARPLVVVCGGVRDGEAPDAAALRRTEQLFAALCAPNARDAEVWAVTAGAVPAVAGDALRLDGAGVWGAGKSAALELPDRWGGLVDLPVDFTFADADRLLDAMTAARGEDQLALRDGAWYAPRLAFAPQDATGAARFRDDAVYWVAGGTGALGRHAVRFLLEHGARRVVVTGRGVDPSVPFSGDVRYIQADVCSRADCLRVLAEIDARGLPLAGVIHAAGIASECAIDALTPEAFHAVADAKIAGAWNLHAVTLDRPIELFVCFSSVAALWGGAGQAHYAAGNHFLDMLCEQRRRLGLPALALAWGPWSGGGMVSPDLAAQLAKIGLDLLDPAAAPAILASSLHGAHACIAAVNLRLDAFAAVYTVRRPSRFLADVLPARAEPQLAAPRALEGLTPEQIRARIGAIVGEQLGTGRRPDPERGLFDLGLDSLAVVAIRARLVAEFGVTLTNADMFSYPTIAALAAHLTELARPASGPDVPGAADVPDDDEAIAALSADEIARRIAVEFDALVQSTP
jgi:acyl transferase domain-containing protein